MSAISRKLNNWSKVFFPIALLILWLFLGNPNPALVVLPLIVFASGKAMMAMVAGLTGWGIYNLTGDQKTYSGSLTFFLAAIMSLVLFPMLTVFSKLPGWEDPFGMLVLVERILLVASIAFCATLAEGLTRNGWGSVTVLLPVAWMLSVWPGKGTLFIWLLFAIILVFLSLSLLAVRMGWLNGSGAVMAVLLGLLIWTGGGWQSIVLLFVFFVTGSLVAKLKGNNGRSDAKQGKPRDYLQVICNGGIAGFCMAWAGLEFQDPAIPFTLFGVSVAVSTADTWSSEIGLFLNGRVVDIVGLKPIPKGVSGGISLKGTIAGAAGAGLIALLAYFLDFSFAWIIFVAGFAGMLLDSLLGSLFQAKYLLHGEISDIPEPWQREENIEVVTGPTENKPEKPIIIPFKGRRWVSNDLVNLMSNLIITFATWILLLILWKGG